jgi:transmembrane sensor
MDQKNSKFKKFEIFQRFIENRYSKEDLEYILRYINDESSEKLLMRTSKDYWYYHSDKLVSQDDEPDYETILDKVHHKINLMMYKPLAAGTTGLGSKIITTSINVFYRVAAIIVIALLIASLYYYLRSDRFIPESQVAYSEIVAPLGSRIKIDLPDGSTAWLNHGTILKYPQKFGERSRELFITGEAYFNVKEDKGHPFILKTSDIDIHVLGTRFNVMAYEDDPEIVITLEEGELDLFYSSRDQSSGKIACLEPGEHIVIERYSKEVSKYSGKTDIYTAWKDGLLVFRDDPMDVIVKKLERWYNVEIEFADEELASYRFTATFTDETLRQVLHLLSVAVPMEYEVTSRIKQSDNTFSKRKVVLKLKK